MSNMNQEWPASIPAPRQNPGKRDFSDPMRIFGKIETSLLKQSGGVMGAKVAQAVLGLATALLLTRLFGAEVFGIYAYALATSTLLSLFTRLGFHAQSIYAINRAFADDQRDRTFTIIATALGTTAVLSALGGASLYLISLFVPDWEMAPSLAYGAPLVLVSALVQVIGSTITAFGRVVTGASVEAVVKPVIFLCAVGLLLLNASPEEIGYEGLLEAFIASQILLCLMSGSYLLWLARRESGPFRLYPKDIWPNVIEAKTFMMANAMLRLYQDMGTMSVGIFFGPVEVAFYRVADQASALILFGFQALQAVLRPRIAKAYAIGGEVKAQLQSQLTTITRWLAILESPLMLSMIFASPWVVLVFGKDFGEAAPVLTILAVGQAFGVLCGLNGDMLNMTGHANIAARWAVAALMVTAVLLWPATLMFGLYGPALAVATTRILWNVALARSARQLTGIHTTVLGAPRA